MFAALLACTSAQVVIDSVVPAPEEPSPSAVSCCCVEQSAYTRVASSVALPFRLCTCMFPSRSEVFVLGFDFMQNAQNIHYKYGFSAQEWIQYPGGLYKASSTANFPASENLSGALVKLNPGGMREMHWHNPNEWGFVVNGTCRATLVNPGSEHMVESCKSVLAMAIWVYPHQVSLYVWGSKASCNLEMAAVHVQLIAWKHILRRNVKRRIAHVIMCLSACAHAHVSACTHSYTTRSCCSTPA